LNHFDPSVGNLFQVALGLDFEEGRPILLLALFDPVAIDGERSSVYYFTVRFESVRILDQIDYFNGLRSVFERFETLNN
jgi:hypothetical protein